MFYLISHSNFHAYNVFLFCVDTTQKVYMLFAQLISSKPTFLQILAYSGIGFLVVMLVLTFQSILTSVLGTIFSAIDKKKQ